MPIVTISTGAEYTTARQAVEAVAPRMALKLAHYHRDLVMQQTPVSSVKRDDVPEEAWRRPRPLDMTHLADTLKIQRDRRDRYAAEFVGAPRWRFVLETGSKPHIIRPTGTPPRLPPKKKGGRNLLRFLVGGRALYRPFVRHPGTPAKRIVSTTANQVLADASKVIDAELRVFLQMTGGA